MTHVHDIIAKELELRQLERTASCAYCGSEVNPRNAMFTRYFVPPNIVLGMLLGKGEPAHAVPFLTCSACRALHPMLDIESVPAQFKTGRWPSSV